MNATTESSQLRNNPVFWIMCALPVAAVLAGLSTLAIALQGADRQLPAAYHWEGEHLDADFARARAAAAAGIELRFASEAGSGRCVAVVTHAPADADALFLQFTHGSNADFDRTLRLARVDAGRYESNCDPLPEGRWRIAAEDATHAWSLRGLASGSLDSVYLRARDPAGSPP